MPWASEARAGFVIEGSAMAAVDVSTPAIVLGIDSQIGLCLVRELGRAGIAVHGVTSDPSSIGLRSRYLTQGHILPGNEPALVEGLAALGRRLGRAYLLAISEPHLQLLNRNRNRLTGVRTLIPDPRQLAAVLDKARTLALARECGITVPETWSIDAMHEIATIASRARFPVILKWSDPNRVAAALRKRALPFHKAEFAATREALHANLAVYEDIGEFPLIQEYVPGRGLGQCVFMHQGEALRLFQHRRLREWPPEGGFSTACEAIPLTEHRELMERSISLLRRMNWEGVAMVEYRYDAETGKAVLMEVNGRFWGGFPLAFHCDAQFGFLTYAVLGNGQLPVLSPPRSDLRCRLVTAELKRLVRVVLQPEKIADPMFERRPMAEMREFLFDFLAPRTRYYVFWRDDPKPFFQDLRNMIATRLLHLPG
jgi:predicted ATP-grasp superfamily ATP-dependent carboligase